jgi:hypothetical protein
MEQVGGTQDRRGAEYLVLSWNGWTSLPNGFAVNSMLAMAR